MLVALFGTLPPDSCNGSEIDLTLSSKDIFSIWCLESRVSFFDTQDPNSKPAPERLQAVVVYAEVEPPHNVTLLSQLYSCENK